jgi:hypothetical protein
MEHVLAEVESAGPAGEPSFSDELKRVFEIAVEEPQRFRCCLIGTEHHLIGLMRDPQTARVLRDAGGDPKRRCGQDKTSDRQPPEAFSCAPPPRESSSPTERR